METLVQTNRKQFEFLGETGEYFKIWIVNVALTILTLGIYSAWAKVRTRRYFYSNTLLMHTPFDYLADPVKILKGRLIALSIFLIYSFSPLISPILQGVLTIFFIVLLPWIIIKALNFNLYNTAYRNIRFSFNGEYLKALWVFIGLAIVTGLTLGFAYPYFNKERKKFIIDNSLYGTSWFEMDAVTSQFYSVYLCAILPILITLTLLFAITNLTGLSSNMEAEKGAVFAGLLTFLVVPVFGLIYAYIYTTIANLVISHTTLQAHSFESTLNTGKIFCLYLSNMLAIIFSFGLLIPWAMIRTARYRISCLAVCPQGDIDDFIAAEEQRAEAIGEEVGDIFDIDIGL